MAHADVHLPLAKWPGIARWAAGLGIGACAGAVVTAALTLHPLLGIGVAVAILGLPLLFLRPDWGVLGFLFSILLIEEFPSWVSESVERSLRTPFYSFSLGVHGLYPTDVLLFGLLAIYGVRGLWRRRLGLQALDRFGIVLLVLQGLIAFAAVLSFATGSPFAEKQILTTSGTDFLVNERGAQFIAFYQYKTYSYLLFSYVLGLLFLDAPRRISQVLAVFLGAALADAVIGCVRLGTQPANLLKGIPLFYHSPTSWIFALVVFYVVLAWSARRLAGARLAWLGALSGLLLVFILMSFRRTMWGGIALASALLLGFIPAWARIRALVAVAAFATLFLLVAGSTVGTSVVNRLEETSVGQPSALYRLSLFVYFSSHWRDMGWFGYGAKPLWNHLIYLGIVPTNLENVHSLYFWLLLRSGVVGFLGSLAALGVALAGLWGFARGARDPRDRDVGVAVLLGLVMLMFSGIFNPVYGEVRYMTVLGFGFAMVSRMIQFEKAAARRGPLELEPCSSWTR